MRKKKRLRDYLACSGIHKGELRDIQQIIKFTHLFRFGPACSILGRIPEYAARDSGLPPVARLEEDTRAAATAATTAAISAATRSCLQELWQDLQTKECSMATL